MDVRAVRSAGENLKGLVKRIDAVLNDVDKVVASLGKNWAGDDQKNFSTVWQRHKGPLHTIARNVGTMGSTCTTQADEQERASV